jgi:sugar phosphate isomerase/epimerase
MRLCVLTDEISQDLDEALDVCARHGFTAIEIRSVWDTPPQALTRRQCREIAVRAADRGVSIAGFASPVFKTPLPDGRGQRTQAEAMLAGALDRCAWLGTGLVRVFSFFRTAAPDVPAAAAAIDAVLGRVATDGVTLGIETGTRTNTPSAALGRELMDLLRRPGVGLVWDPGNTVFSGFGDGSDLGGLPDVEQGALVHVHVKDPLGTSRYVELGHGTLPWPEILAGLADRGYRGHLSLETHWRPGRLLTAAERDEPWGSGFSSGGLEASERCMATLASWAGEAA